MLDLVEGWARAYSDSAGLSAAVGFLHLAGILAAGGLSVATDRASLALKPDAEPDLPRELARLRAVHAWVLGGLALTAATGVAMLLADARVYLTSLLFWLKMVLVALLLGNGWLRLKAERALESGLDAWSRFRWTSLASVVLWFGVLLAGAFLRTIS